MENVGNSNVPSVKRKQLDFESLTPSPSYASIGRHIHPPVLFSPAGSAVPVHVRDRGVAVGGANRGSAPDVAREQQQQQQLVQQKEKERNSDPVREPAPARDKQPGEDMEKLPLSCLYHCISLPLSLL